MSIQYASEELKRKFSRDQSLGFARRGEALFLENKTDEAIDLLVDGVKRHPDYLTGLLVLGRIYHRTNRFPDAKFQLETALRLDERCPAALSLLADMAESLPKPVPQVRKSPVVAQVDHFVKSRVQPPKKAEVADPDFEEAEDGDTDVFPHVATVTLAEIYFQQGLKEQALQIYRQLLARQPDNETVKRRLQEIEASAT